MRVWLWAPVLLVVVATLSGCPGRSQNQLDAPPPPLAKPSGELRDQMLQLVPVTSANPAPLVEMRLATGKNGLGKALYKEADIVVRQQTLQMLEGAQKKAGGAGFSLLVFDGARTPDAQRALAALVGNDRVLAPDDPKLGSPTTRGASVDVGLVNVKKDRQELPMGSAYMDPSPRSLASDLTIDQEAGANRSALDRLMLGAGFRKGTAWWSYYDPEWAGLPVVQDTDYKHALAVPVPPAPPPEPESRAR
jgi:D-alanyl-D-alanine dipeptidase